MRSTARESIHVLRIRLRRGKPVSSTSHHARLPLRWAIPSEPGEVQDPHSSGVQIANSAVTANETLAAVASGFARLRAGNIVCVAALTRATESSLIYNDRRGAHQHPRFRANHGRNTLARHVGRSVAI